MNTEERSCYSKLVDRVEELEKQMAALCGLRKFNEEWAEHFKAQKPPEEQPTFQEPHGGDRALMKLMVTRYK